MHNAPMAGKRRKFLQMSAAVAALILFGLIVFVATAPAPIPPLPKPNGYDDFLSAGAMVRGSVGNYTALDHDQLSVLISTNADSLRQLRVGLTRACSLPTGFTFTNLSLLKSLVQLLAAEGRLAEMEGRPVDAAQSYVDAIRFGNEMSRGGFLLYRLVGIACENMGYLPLAKLVPQLSCEQAKPIIAALEKIDEDGVRWDDVLRAERRFARHELRQTHNPIAWVSSWWANRRAIEKAREKHYVMLARLRLVAGELALRCYRSAHGNPPDRLEQLTPDYLQRTLLDPFSGQLLAYRRQGTNWLLYSFGVDGVDDGGKAVGRSVQGVPNHGDLFYDSPW